MIRSNAAISACGKYRYWLTRTWNEKRRNAAFVMLNPSTADARYDDPTIRRCIGFAKAWGCGGIEVVNLFAFRATDPEDLKKQGPATVGGGVLNDDWIVAVTNRCFPVVCAWGSHGNLWNRSRTVRTLLRKQGEPYPVCLGLTKDKQPRHPLYVKGDALLIPFIR